MTSNKNNKRSQPLVTYQPTEDDDGKVNRAFDILFEETLKQNENLTTSDS